MARCVVRYSYCSRRDGSGGHRSSLVGCRVGREHNPGQVRQYVVLALAGGTAKDHLMMHLLRCLHFFTASHQIGIQSRHVAGAMNVAADALSRNNQSTFFQCIPQASKEPSIELLEILLHQCPDWYSHNWRRMFHSVSGKLWPHQQ